MQAIFKEGVVDQLQAIKEAYPEEDVQVWFGDEARFGQRGTLARVRARIGQRGTLARVRARRGSRPRGVRQNQYVYLYVLTAVCVGTGAASGLISPTLSTGVINLFLEQFSRQLAAGCHAVLV